MNKSDSRSCLHIILTRWDDTVTLALPVRHLSLVVNDNITGLSDSLGPDYSFHRHNFADERLFGLEKLHWDILLLPVRLSLKVVLSLGCGLGKGGTNFKEEMIISMMD